jgi:hypothetical protein
MTVATQPGYDVTATFLSHVPNDGLIRALYVTGSGGIPATPQELAANPGCLRIDQSPINTALDEEADYLDYENGAAGAAQLAPWAKAALANFKNATRPGQRSPAVYMSRNNVTAVVNALIAGGVTGGIGLVIADWNFDPVQAAREVSNSSGPWPIVGRQYSDKGGGGLYDLDIFSKPWVANVSHKVPPPPPPVLRHAELVTGGPDAYTPKAVTSTDGVTWR